MISFSVAPTETIKKGQTQATGETKFRTVARLPLQSRDG